VFMARPGIRYRCARLAKKGPMGRQVAQTKVRYLGNDGGNGLLSQCLWVIRVRGALANNSATSAGSPVINIPLSLK